MTLKPGSEWFLAFGALVVVLELSRIWWHWRRR